MRLNILATCASLWACAGQANAKGPIETAKELCSDPNTGAFVALVADDSSFDDVAGIIPDSEHRRLMAESGGSNRRLAETKTQRWMLQEEKRNDPDAIRGSLTGKYLQLVPDLGVSYPARGKHVTNVHKDLQEGRAPFVNFRLYVEKDGEGWHTLFVRWTGGDITGGGDSFYVSLFEYSKRRYPDSQKIVPAQRTLKPKVVPISSGITDYAGCCYNPNTHACPCYDQWRSETDCHNFIDRNRAAEMRVQCPVGHGVTEFVHDPQWYLYAGQDVGNSKDFNSEPWDVTCEAEGDNTVDSGKNFASWYLMPGRYDLRIYGREDGTALDAIYVAGPKAETPIIGLTYNEGDSTLCKKYEKYEKPKRRKRRFMISMGFLSAFGVLGFALYIKFTERGQDLTHQASMVVGSFATNDVPLRARSQYAPMHNDGI